MTGCQNSVRKISISILFYWLDSLLEKLNNKLLIVMPYESLQFLDQSLNNRAQFHIWTNQCRFVDCKNFYLPKKNLWQKSSTELILHPQAKALATRSTSRGPYAHLVFTARVRHSKSSKITYPVKKRESTSGSPVPLSFISSTHPFSQGVLVTRLFCHPADSQNQILQKLQILTTNLNKISFFHYTKRSFFLGIAKLWYQ